MMNSDCPEFKTALSKHKIKSKLDQMNSNLRQTLWALNLFYYETIPRKTPQKGITFTMDFDRPKLARVRAQKREKRTIRCAARLRVQSEDLDDVLDAAR